MHYLQQVMEGIKTREKERERQTEIESILIKKQMLATSNASWNMVKKIST